LGFGVFPFIGYNLGMKQRKEQTDTHIYLRKVKGFHTVSYRILQLANQGLLRTDFQHQVSKLLIAFTGCDSIELWLRDHEKYYPSKTSHLSSRSSKVDFRTFPPCETIKRNSDSMSLAHKPSGSSEFKSVVTIPVGVDKENIGLLQLMSKQRDYFSKDMIKLYRGLTPILGIASVHRNIQVDLRERVKELTCLYGISHLGADSELSLDQVLQGVVGLLPPAWLHPEITSAKIALDRRVYFSPGFKEGLNQQRAEIFISGEKRGVVEVTYQEKKPELDEGPFLKEERSLIDAVAKEVAIILKRRQDEEEKLRLEEQLQHADRLVTIGQLAAGVAHELNEPLGSILGFAELVQKSPGIPQQAEQDVGKILNASLYAREVVKKLLIFARQMPPKKVWVNLNQVIEEGLYFLESRFAKEGIELVRSFDPKLPNVYADPSQLNQVLVNLVVNALQAMKEGGKLSIKTSSNGDFVFLMVEDTGVGMSEEILKKIFTPFFTTKDVGQGTGLGLPVVHGIISSHEGSIKVESKVGRGTQFEIQIPVKGPQEIRN
jgi:signal transduction histidine kinase